MKKVLLFFWCLYFSATCKQAMPGADLIFINATAQMWSGGAAGSGHGTNYNFYFINKTPSITYDSVWVDGFVLPATAETKGDTLHISARAYFRGTIGHLNGENGVEPKHESPPMVVKDPAVISYSNGKTNKFITAPAMKRLQPIAYP